MPVATGEVGQLSDADEVRIIFSEPMVALGTVPPGSAPPWLRVTPTAPGSFYWSRHQDADLFAGRLDAVAQRDEVHGSR